MAADIRRVGGDPPSPYEERYGFSRAVVVGGEIHVGGTTAVGPLGSIVGESPYELARLGAGAESVFAVRAYVTDISRHEDIARAFGEAFGEVRPLFTLVEVSALIDPRMSVEIEVSALASLSARAATRDPAAARRPAGG
jgi:enamine deaminase RidA (YjgF/YER057c/UK114 family)